MSGVITPKTSASPVPFASHPALHECRRGDVRSDAIDQGRSLMDRQPHSWMNCDYWHQPGPQARVFLVRDRSCRLQPLEFFYFVRSAEANHLAQIFPHLSLARA